MSAYRQCPVKEPSHAFMLLQLPTGTSVWRHSVLPFWAAPSVWHFNRCTDALVWLARCLLLILALHYVDDVGGAEPEPSASSACEAFRQLCDILGIRVKPSKEQLPAFRHKVLGVWLQVCSDYVEVHPDENRVTKVIRALQTSLDEDRLSPEEASRLCGKLVFLRSSMFGMVGRAAMHPLYARFSGGHEQALQLNQGLRSAMTTLISLLRQARPRRIPLHPQKGCASIVYADAYFKLGERLWKVGHASPKHWTRQATTELENGWGFLVKTGDVVSAAHGRVPAEIIRLFSSRKAYIFFLEVNAQILALLANRRDFLDSGCVSSTTAPVWRHWLAASAGNSRSITCLHFSGA